MGTFGGFKDFGFVATWGLARFCGRCPLDGVRAEEVLRVGCLSYPSREEILTWIWSTMSRTDRFRRCQTPKRDEKISPLLP